MLIYLSLSLCNCTDWLTSWWFCENVFSWSVFEHWRVLATLVPPLSRPHPRIFWVGHWGVWASAKANELVIIILINHCKSLQAFHIFVSSAGWGQPRSALLVFVLRLTSVHSGRPRSIKTKFFARCTFFVFVNDCLLMLGGIMVMAATVDLPRQASTSSPQTRLWGGNIKSRGSLMILSFYWTLYWSFESKFNKIGRKLGPHRCSEVRCIEPTVGAPSPLIHRGSNQMSCLDWRVKSTPSSDIGPSSIWGTCYVDIWGVWEGVNLCARW